MSNPASNRWTSPHDVRARLRRRWERGEILADSLADASLFPLRIPIKGPGSKEISADFSASRDWIATWRDQRGVDCEWKAFTHRLFGTNEIPSAALFSDLSSVVRLLGVRNELETFQTMIEYTRGTFPELLPWLAKRAMLAIAISPDWEALLTVVKWVKIHPECDIYLRQIDAPGVHTKLIERHRGSLTELLDLAVSAESIRDESRGVSGFNRRYGFREKPERIRLRFLDPASAIESERLGMDLTVTASALVTMKPKVDRVFITENEINFLAFPDHLASLVIFGAGYGWSALANADWLHNCEIHYWGDLDSHGFAILNQLRAHFPHVRSLLMNQETLDSLRELCTTEPNPNYGQFHRLTSDESLTLERLRNDPNSTRLRLEQEKIPFGMLQNALCEISNDEIIPIKSGGFPDAIQDALGPV